MSRRQKGEKNLPAKIPKTGKGARVRAGRPEGTSLLDLDPGLVEKICKAIRIGSHIETAAAINGVGYSTLREWVLRAKEDPNSIYGEFSRALQKALGEAETRDLAVIDVFAIGRPAQYEMEPVQEVVEKEGVIVFGPGGKPLTRVVKDAEGKPVMQVARDAEGNPIIKRSEVKPAWQPAAWKLERRFPMKWGRFDRVDVDHRHLNPEREVSKAGGSEKPRISLEDQRRNFEEMVSAAKALEDCDDDPFSPEK